MKKIAIITATRAEYGLLSPVIKELRKYEGSGLRVELIVTGTHLSHLYGHTIDEIHTDGQRIDRCVEIPVNSNSEMDISYNQSETLNKFTNLFCNEKYDAIVILGDRYEMLAIAIAASNTKTPIFHLCGGDTTEGAMDEWIRHSITKMSYIHFVTNLESERRVIQLGESPNRVYNYGSTSIDNILKVATLSKEAALETVGLGGCRYILCTYHPVTMENNSVDEQINHFVSAIAEFKDIQFIVTKSNADQGGARINQLLDEAASKLDNMHVFTSLGIKRYLSLMKYAECVVGNSSSGIIETPAFNIPTVNIGDRQRGRLQAKSIINCGVDKQSIVEAIYKALSNEFRMVCDENNSLYGTGCAASQISKKVYELVTLDEIDLKKKFFDMEINL